MDPAGDERPAALGQPIRCLLYAHPDEFRLAKQQALEEHLAKAFATQPALAIAVGTDTISVIDLSTDAVIASAGLAQVTATPETYSPLDHTGEGVSKRFTQPLLLLTIPGLPDLRIAILPMRFSPWTGQQFRYAWPKGARARDSHSTALSPTHVVRDSEWPTLLENFGLAAVVVDEYASGSLDRRERLSKVFVSAGLALILVATTAVLVWSIVTGAWQL